MRRVLVTGASGFIGRHTAPDLLERGFEVHVVQAPGFPALTWPGVRIHTADLLEPKAQTALLEAVQPTHMLHLAWYVAHGAFWTSLENVRWVKASLDLLQAFAANGGQHWVGAGTCAEYDWSGAAELISESAPLAPATLYGAAKAGCYGIQRAMARQLGVRFAWGRVFHLYGPHEGGQRLIPHIACSLIEGVPVKLTAGTQVRDFLHVEDVARSFVAALDSSLEDAFNIGLGRVATIREAAGILAGLAGRPELLEFGALPLSPSDPARLVPDTERLRGIGFVPRYTLEAGLRHTWEWWQSRYAEKEMGNR